MMTVNDNNIFKEEGAVLVESSKSVVVFYRDDISALNLLSFILLKVFFNDFMISQLKVEHSCQVLEVFLSIKFLIVD